MCWTGCQRYGAACARRDAFGGDIRRILDPDVTYRGKVRWDPNYHPAFQWTPSQGLGGYRRPLLMAYEAVGIDRCLLGMGQGSRGVGFGCREQRPLEGARIYDGSGLCMCILRHVCGDTATSRYVSMLGTLGMILRLREVGQHLYTMQCV
jgi:hypothetical protein